jgi:hypothetical protein
MEEARNILTPFLASPRVLLLVFMWSMCTLVAVKTSNIKPVRWVFVLTVLMLLFRMLPV